MFSGEHISFFSSSHFSFFSLTVKKPKKHFSFPFTLPSATKLFLSPLHANAIQSGVTRFLSHFFFFNFNGVTSHHSLSSHISSYIKIQLNHSGLHSVTKGSKKSH